MSGVDLHPDDLLDRAVRGDLGGADEARLAAHLAICDACAVERRAATDFRRHPRKLPGDDALVTTLVAKTMGRAAAPGTRKFARTLVGSQRAAAAVVVLVAAGASAALWLGGRNTARSGRSTVSPVLSPWSKAGEATEPPMLGPVPALAPPEAQEVDRSMRHEARRIAAPSAEALFTRANSARRSGGFEHAVADYRELHRLYPGTREEIASRVILGMLLLDRMRDAQGALALFDSYLVARPTGPVAEEALVGRADALRRLGRATEEREAWERLLANYPDSAHAARGRQRLEALR